MAAKKKKRKRRAQPAFSPAAEARRRWLRVGLVIVAGAYLLTIWLDAIGTNIPYKFLPRTWVYFAQIAKLFPKAAEKVIDYRAEGWSCSDHKWHELDVRPYFPIDKDDKENRFPRAVQFYRRNAPVLQALDEFIVRKNNASSANDPIGGVRLLSLRIPFPKPGEKVEAFTRRPISTYPKDYRHNWYVTPKERRAERCGYTMKPDEPPEAEPVPSAWPADPKELEP